MAPSSLLPGSEQNQGGVRQCSHRGLCGPGGRIVRSDGGCHDFMSQQGHSIRVVTLKNLLSLTLLPAEPSIPTGASLIVFRLTFSPLLGNTKMPTSAAAAM